jgi:hypothetical protein
MPPKLSGLKASLVLKYRLLKEAVRECCCRYGECQGQQHTKGYILPKRTSLEYRPQEELVKLGSKLPGTIRVLIVAMLIKHKVKQ